MQHAGADVGNMNLIARQLEAVHELHRRSAAALDVDGHNARGAQRQVLLRTLVVLVARQCRIANGCDLVARLEELGNGQRILTVLAHTHRKGLQTEVEQERRVRRRIAAEITHQLHTRLDDVRHRAELAGVDYAVVAFVRLGEIRELARCRPVKLAAVHDHAAALYGMAVHVLGSRVDDNIRAPFDWPAQHRRCERVVHDERHVVLVRDVRPLFNVEHGQSRIGERLTEHRLGVGLEQLLHFLLACLCVRPDALDAEFFERYAEQVDRAAVDGGSRDEAVACRAQIEDGQQGCRLTGRGQHRADAALEGRDLLLYRIAGRVGKARVDALHRHVEQGRDLCGRVKAVSGGLHDRHDARTAVFRLVAFMQAFCFDFHINYLFTMI